MRARAFTGTLLLIALALSANLAYPQVPHGISYQAVVRDGSGNPIASKIIGMRITLENVSGTAYYTETQATTTSGQGVISVTIGGGSQVGSNAFTSIPWKNGDVYLKVEIDPSGGSSYNPIGIHTQLQSVPYALYAENTKEVVSQPNATDEDPIFVVRNKAGKIVFAVYQTGVRVYVEDTPVKGTKGGFAVGGLSGQNKGEVEYLRITPDSARISINEIPSVKGTKGGFAVGGLSGVSKATTRDLMFVALDSARIYIDSAKTVKGTKGGFAVGGLSGVSKGSNYNLLKVTADSTRIYVNENPTKGTKGGFAVGGLSGVSKTSSSNYLDLTPDNYFIGQDAGKIITTGLYNSFMGYEAGKNNKSGSKNIFLGYQAGFNNDSASYDVFIGNESGLANISGGYNVFIGYQTGYSNTSGEYNVALGHKSLHSNTSGSNNVANGNQSLFSNINGSDNTANGYEALYSNIDGIRNVADGHKALYKNTSGDCNTACGYMTLYSNTGGTNNVAVGYGTLFANTTGYNNTALGNNCFTTGTVYYNSTALGANSSINASNKIRLGNTAVTVIEGQVTFTNPSDGRFKFNITEEVKGLDFITRLHPVVYNFDTRKYDAFMMKDMPTELREKNMKNTNYNESSSIRQSGFIAQEVEEAAKESAYIFNGINKPQNENDSYSLSYSLFTVPLVKAVQELNAKNKELQDQINQLKNGYNRISSLESENIELKQRMEKLEKTIESLSK